MKNLYRMILLEPDKKPKVVDVDPNFISDIVGCYRVYDFKDLAFGLFGSSKYISPWSTFFDDGVTGVHYYLFLTPPISKCNFYIRNPSLKAIVAKSNRIGKFETMTCADISKIMNFIDNGCEYSSTGKIR